MAAANESDSRIPVICADKSAVVGAEIFDPNSWAGASKGVIQSCWTECSVLHHCVEQIVELCGQAEHLCQSQIKSVQDQWNTRKFDLEKVMVYGQQPDLHMRIEAFFSGIKTLLDLIVQLLSTEKVVGGVVHGFHRAQDIYGGQILKILENNASNDRKEVASRAAALISQHKAAWIDQAVFARDQLVHPNRGMHQLMFHLEFAEKDGKLICVKVTPPQVDSLAVDQYARGVLKHAQEFSSAFLALLQEAAVSKSVVQLTPGSGLV
jgi:hypothetical protein